MQCRVLPSVYREASYSGLRLGLYDPVKALYGDTNQPGLFGMFDS
jgi:hypothetical protein